jgi:hypothetical protein
MTASPTPVTAIDLDFGDGRYRFWMDLPQTIEFERKHGSILGAERALHGSIGFDEDGNPVFVGGGDASGPLCREVVRLALIGRKGGTVDEQETEVGPRRASELVDLYTWPERPLGETAALAWQVLAAAVFGNPGYQAQKAAAGDG